MSVLKDFAVSLERTSAAQRIWTLTTVSERAGVLDAWACAIEENSVRLADQIVADVGKPRSMAIDEVRRAAAHIRSSARLPEESLGGDRRIAQGVIVRQVPLGLVAVITPWNNPVALPVAKVAAALVCGNAVALKPAPEGDELARDLVALLMSAGCPENLVTVVSGGPETGEQLARSADVDGIAVTGSIATGQVLSRIARERGVPLQAELGGNNAAIIVGPVDLDRVVADLAVNAFAFAGQRCTAVRRFVVEESLLDDFVAAMAARVSEIVVMSPEDESTLLGPVISPEAGRRIRGTVQEALTTGCELVGRGHVAHGDSDAPISDTDVGRSVEPMVLLAPDASHEIVQTETFGPVAVIQPARDLDHAIELANGVEQGLLMAVCTDDDALFDEVSRRALVGIVQRGGAPVPVHADAPFGGWKASGIGAPEHGEWDVQFFTRPQARYDSAAR